MIISDSTHKHFGSHPTTKNIAICLIANIIGNDYNSSVIHGSEVDTINFEIRCTDIAATILQVILSTEFIFRRVPTKMAKNNIRKEQNKRNDTSFNNKESSFTPIKN